MRRSSPDLIVPIRDRRKRVRILTLRNAGGALLIALVAFGLFELASRFRRPAEDEYGRLLNHQMETGVVASRAPAAVAVPEPIEDQTAADPMLTGAAARSQYLGTPAPLQPAATVNEPIQPKVVEPTGGVAIVGDGTQVTVVRGARTRPAPELSGGIFKP